MVLNQFQRAPYLLISMFFCLGISSCISNKTKVENSNSLLVNCWTHSYEDNTDDKETYLLCDAKDFPPSRFRASFTLANDGSCTYKTLAPNDAHFQSDGTWTYDQESKQLVIKGSDGTIANTYVVELLESDRLLVKNLN